MAEWEFPQFRCLSNQRSKYKILSDRLFIEKQQLGSKYILHEIEAKQYPEILRIQDMLSALPPYEMSTEEEFERG